MAAHALLHSGKGFLDPTKMTKDNELDTMYLELHGLGRADGIEAKEIQSLQNDTHRDLLDVVSYRFLMFLRSLIACTDFNN